MTQPVERIARVLAADTKRRQRNARIEKWCAAILADWIYAFYAGWMFMLIVGIVHSRWIPALPTIGYWSSVIVLALLNSVTGFSRRRK